MIKGESFKTLLGAALVSAGGEVPLDHLESLLREKYDLELPVVPNHVALEKYLVTNFSDICRVKRAVDGHFVVRVLQLPAIAHLLPDGYIEPEFEPLAATEFHTPAPEPARVSKENVLDGRHRSDTNITGAAAVINAPIGPSRLTYNTISPRNDSQDDHNNATILANLENQLAEECSVRGIIEPIFTLRTTSGGGLKEVFCVATWGNEKIQSYPAIFTTEEGAKADVIKKMLIGIDELAQKILSYQSCTENLAESANESHCGESSEQSCANVTGEASGTESHPIVAQEKRLLGNDGLGLLAASEPETSSRRIDHGAVAQKESISNISFNQTDVLSLACGRAQGLIPNLSPVDLEPRIDMEQPVSQGYLTHVLEDGSFVVQVKGPGLARWERQTFAFDPQSPTEKILPFRWYVTRIKEGTSVDFYDRVMCMSEGPCIDERGFVQLYFPDNGYEDFVDPNVVFDLENYEEINRVPVQGVRIHAVGLTGGTPVEELRVKHPPHDQLLFLPADRSNCFMSNCSTEVPHVYIYDMDLKRVLC